MAKSIVRIVALGLVVAVLGACVAVPVMPAGTPTPGGGGLTSPAEGPDADAAAELATQVLLSQLDMLGMDVEVVSIEQMEWTSSALGCPAPDQMYLTVIVPGYKVMVKVNGQEYAVHVGGENAVVCSEEGTPVQLQMSQPTENTDAVISQAKADLSERLQMPADDIELVKVQSVQWRSSGLGCEQPGGRYLTVIVPGNLVVLKAGDTLYEYHTGDNRVVMCSSTASQ